MKKTDNQTNNQTNTKKNNRRTLLQFTALTVGLKRGGLLLSLLVLPMYVPTLIFGAEVVRRGASGLDFGGALLFLAAITFGSLALLPFAAAAVLRVNLR